MEAVLSAEVLYPICPSLQPPSPFLHSQVNKAWLELRNLDVPTPIWAKQKCSDFRVDGEVGWGRPKTYEVVQGGGPVSGCAESGIAEPGRVGQPQLGGSKGTGLGSAPPARREVEAERCDCGVEVPRHLTCDAAAVGLSSALMWFGPTSTQSRGAADPRLRWSRRPRG